MSWNSFDSPTLPTLEELERKLADSSSDYAFDSWPTYVLVGIIVFTVVFSFVTWQPRAKQPTDHSPPPQKLKKKSKFFGRKGPDLPSDSASSVSSPTAKPSPAPVEVKDPLLTRKTRQEMFTMISQVRSLESLPKAKQVEAAEFVIRNPEEELTDVKTEVVEGQKFSKMTIDASFVFDDDSKE